MDAGEHSIYDPTPRLIYHSERERKKKDTANIF
jgi:hypothetical protein